MDLSGWILNSVVIVISLASVGLAYRSHKSSEESAEAAKRAVAIQEREHKHSRSANLYILRPSAFVRFGETDLFQALYYNPLQFMVRNEGGASAFDIRATLKSTLPFNLSSGQDEMIELPSGEEYRFFYYFEPKPESIPLKPTIATWVIHYRDLEGPHELSVTFQWQYVPGEAVVPEITSALLDGQPHHQHPATAVQR